MRLRSLLPALFVLAGMAQAQTQLGASARTLDCTPCDPKTAIEFISPMITEEVPNFHGTSPNPESWNVILEVALDQRGIPLTPVFEGTFLPSPGAAAPLPTDVNGDTVLGDPHPAIPGLTLVMDDDLMFAGFVIPAGTNLASFIELIGSEEEHGSEQSTTLTWILDPAYMIIDLNGDMATTLTARLNGKTDKVKFNHGWDLAWQGTLSSHTPTITIMTADWISTVDRDIPAQGETPFLVCVEVRIPCYFDGTTTPPTPVPLDPIFGPCWAGAVACTGNVGIAAGPGFHPAFPALDVRFSDDYMDAMGTAVPGGVITGGACGIIWGSTGASLAYLFQQASVHAWYGVNGVIDTTPLGGGDDQLIYRFTMIADGTIMDTDVMPREMMITAAIESTTNCFSITNLRVKHRRKVKTPDPQ